MSVARSELNENSTAFGSLLFRSFPLLAVVEPDEHLRCPSGDEGGFDALSSLNISVPVSQIAQNPLD